jgi:predicted dehydrogenase
LHVAECEMALEGGKHVLCEKPLGLDSRETSRLVELARSRGRAGAVAHNLRYYPMCQEARALLGRGAIGEPRLVHGSYLQDWLLYPSDWNWRLDPQVSGAMRTVADVGTHWLDMMMWMTGKRVTELCADLATVVPVRERPSGPVETFQQRTGSDFEPVQIDTEDYASVLLHFEAGIRGVMTVSQVSPGRKNRFWFEIDGSEGSLAWDGEQPNVLWIGKRREMNRELVKDPALMSPEARGFAAYPAGHAEGYADTFVQLFKQFYAYLEHNDLRAPRPFPTFEDGHLGLLLCEAIAQSARERNWVKVPPSF